MRSFARAHAAALAILASLVVAPAAHAQENRVTEAAVTLDAYMARVRAHHPVARQARLLVDVARAEQQVARGAFDPVVAAAWERKTFGSTEYYDYATAKLTIPTPTGVDVVVGWERADGRYISPDRRTPGAGLVTAGLSIPIGQRMLTDERRTALAVARAMRTAADADRDAAVNKLLLAAAKDYGGWYEAWRRDAIAVEGLALAEFRLAAIRRRVQAGEAAALDTIEAALEVQRRLVHREETGQALFAAKLQAEAHLWGTVGEPVALPDAAVPVAAIPRSSVEAGVSDTAFVQRWIADAERTHPDVRRVAGRLEGAAAQRDFARQGLLPAVDVSASALAAGDAWRGALDDARSDDTKVGAGAKVPLLFLRERGRLAAAAAREGERYAELVRVRREVAIAVRTAANQRAVVDRLLTAQRDAVRQARLLRDGEQRRFEAGESTLFLVNTRERVVLDEAAKLAGLEAKRLVAEVELTVAIGRP
jgi:outer membrane protein TolC